VGLQHNLSITKFNKQACELSHVYIGKGSAITLATMTRKSDTLVLSLATLGRATEIEMILIAKANKEGIIVSLYRRHFHVQTSPM
jgi:hypothetical protein